MQGFQAFPRNISKAAEMDSFSAQLPYKDEESGLNKAKDQVNELIRRQVLARITVHKIGFLPFSILLRQIL